MPKIKTPKNKGSKTERKTKAKTGSKSKAGLPSLDELINLPELFELARGPILRVKFPKVDEDEDTDDEPLEVPQTLEELRRLYKQYPKIEVFDRDGEVMFDGPLQVRDFVQIRAGEVGGKSVEDSEQWYAQILYIGARNSPNKKAQQDGQEKEQPDVCLHVAWFYDHGMLDQRTLPPEDKRSCSNMIQNELIYSDHRDNIHLSSLLAAVDITFFDELSTSQAPIMPGELFYRRTICQDRIISSKNSCIPKCKSAYKPDRDIQHFCTRLACRRWFHTTCLAPNKASTNDFRLEYDLLPSEEQQLVDIVSSRASRGKVSHTPKSASAKSKFGNVGASSETEVDPVMSPDPEPHSLLQRQLALVRSLPAQLRALATSAITRGIDSGQGIVGGAYPILQARWLARKVIIEGGILTQQEENDLMDAATAANPEGLKITPRKYVCPGCGGPI